MDIHLNDDDLDQIGNELIHINGVAQLKVKNNVEVTTDEQTFLGPTF